MPSLVSAGHLGFWHRVRRSRGAYPVLVSHFTIKCSARINATPERVREWFTDPDRMSELDELAQRAGIDVSVNRTTVDGMRVVTWSFKDGRGWSRNGRKECAVDLDGRRLWSEEGLSNHKDDLLLTSPNGTVFHLTCIGSIQHKRLPDGSTDVMAIHHKSLTGGSWLVRFDIRRRQQIGVPKAFRQLMTRCRADLKP